MPRTPLDDVRLIQLQTVPSHNGNLTVIEGRKDVPFEIKRVFYIYSLPGEGPRGNHANRRLHELLICLRGSFEVNLDDGFRKLTFKLDHPTFGLYIPPMIWTTQRKFESGSIYLVLASTHYSAADYFRDYDEFLRAARSYES
jgi:WxcM-like, C-terminal